MRIEEFEKIISDFEKRYEISFINHFNHAWNELKKFEQDGLVKLDSNKIYLTPVGTLFTRNIAMPFDRHLTESRSINFSKTI